MLSLIVPVFNEMHPARVQQTAALSTRLRDLDSFFKPFQIEVEVVFVVDPITGAKTVDPNFDLLQKYSFQKLHPKILKNPKHLGRSRSIARGIQEANGDFLIPLALDLPVPLSDIFSIYQELLSNSNFDFVLGNRFTSRKKRHGRKANWHKVLEDIVQEKAKLKLKNQKIFIQDPLSSVWGFKKKEAQLIVKVLTAKNQWYFMPTLISELTKNSVKIMELPVVFRDDPHSHIPLVKEYLTNFF